jgi:curved DNA-binding protein CbpA
MDGRRARALLGVSDHASAEEVRRAFRTAALASHPDRGGDRSLFELQVLAYETLQHVDVVPPPRPVRESLRPAVRFDRYDSAPRLRIRRHFDDVLRAAIRAQM